MSPAVFVSKEGGLGAGRSGLTGRPDLPDPPSPRSRGFGTRLGDASRAASGTALALCRVLGLVWKASPWLTLGLGATAAASGAVPAATAVTARLLINAVLRAVAVHAGRLPDQAVAVLPLSWAPVVTASGLIVLLAGAQFLIYTLSSLLNAVRNLTRQLLEDKLSLVIQVMVMEQASRLDLPFFEDPASYDLLRNAQNEAPTRAVSMVSSAFTLIQLSITCASVIVLLAGLSPLLALVALVSPLPAFVADSRYGWRSFVVARWGSPLVRRMHYLASVVTTDRFAKEVKLFDLGPYLIRRFRMLAGVYYDRQRRLVTRRSLSGVAWNAITTLAGSLTYLYVALQAAAGRLTLGDLALYTAAGVSLQSSVQGLLDSFSTMWEHNLFLNQVFELLAIRPRITNPERPRPLPRPVRGHVVFEQVSFTYGGSPAPALRDVCFELAPGETVAVVGPNGAGKSTLLKLICRLYDPTAGRILLDGTDVRELDQKELRASVSAIFQDYVTYQGTVSENIGVGDLGHIEDGAWIEEAARRGGADRLIERLPAGYDTPLGKWFDKGVDLSGGEWQRVALSRAFMRDAPILLLDEPTAALDADAESELLRRLALLASGRTTLYVSHRFSSVRGADRIVFLEGGSIVEEGTHDQLMSLGGRYARLFEMQARAYADVLG